MDSKFWIEDPKILIESNELIPLPKTNLSRRLNALTRLTVVLTVIICLFDTGTGLYFFVFSILLIIIVHCIKMNKTKEKFTQSTSLKNTKAPFLGQPYNVKNLTNRYMTEGRLSQSVSLPRNDLFCNDEASIEPGSIYNTLNQRLVGKANPKTLIPPVIVPPSNDLDYWKANDLINYSQINDETESDVYLSGYAVSNCCSITQGKRLVPVSEQKFPTKIGGACGPSPACSKDGIAASCGSEFDVGDIVEEEYTSYDQAYPKGKGIKAPTPAEMIPTIPYLKSKENFEYDDYSRAYPKRGNGIKAPSPAEMIPTIPYLKEDVETFDLPYDKAYPKGGRGIKAPTPAEMIPTIPYLKREDYEGEVPREIAPNESGWVNTMSGYNPEQVFTSDLPSNLSVGNCPKDPVFKNYNKNMFTQIISPGMYTRNQVNEPINANIGISFTQQFEPVTCSRDESGIHYLQHDPRIIEPAFTEPTTACSSIGVADVYDPRQNGYGSSYRSYYDPNTGNVKYYYDDVNAIKMPNYVSRSNIDFLPYADSYGPIREGNAEGNVYTGDIKGLVQDSWMRNSLQFREDMMERLMRKRNSEMWQQRQAPIHTTTAARRH